MYVYCIKTCDNAQLVKIGKSACPEKRLIDIQVSNPTKLQLLYKIPCKSDAHALNVERMLHRHFKALKVRGEWYRLSSQLRQFFESAQQGEIAGAQAALRAHIVKVTKESQYKPRKRG